MPDSPERRADEVPHQGLVEDVIDERLDGVLAENIAITNASAAATSPPTKTEFDALVTKFNAVLAALRNSQIIP